jgi:Zn-dependent peptidase ImmA (M78 family)
MRDYERLAADWLMRTGGFMIPVPLEEVARKLGARVSYQPFEDQLSGMLYREGSDVLIGINSAHSHARQRFTLAHEIGHLLLHKGRAVIVDKAMQQKLARVNQRDGTSSKGTDLEEIQANKLGAALLMPRQLLIKEAQRRISKPGVSIDFIVEELATLFQASSTAMEYRLVDLGLHLPR